ncbi:MAG: hypothetical protein HC793_00310 [Aquincola sp.]|nr:hypothetical protein [Aquincola sp.]
MSDSTAGEGALVKTSQQVEVPGTETPLDLFLLKPQIVAELAAGLSTAADVRQRYGISPTQWKQLAKNQLFRSMLAEALTRWRGDTNTSQRITLKAEMILEDAIPAYDKMIHDPLLSSQARIDAGKLLAALAGPHKTKKAPRLQAAASC